MNYDIFNTVNNKTKNSNGMILNSENYLPKTITLTSVPRTCLYFPLIILGHCLFLAARKKDKGSPPQAKKCQSQGADSTDSSKSGPDSSHSSSDSSSDSSSSDEGRKKKKKKKKKKKNSRGKGRKQGKRAKNRKGQGVYQRGNKNIQWRGKVYTHFQVYQV